MSNINFSQDGVSIVGEPVQGLRYQELPELML